MLRVGVGRQLLHECLCRPLHERRSTPSDAHPPASSRDRVAEEALRVAGTATEEVRRLQATVCQLDRQLGWAGAAAEQRFEPLDVHGALAWQPAGKQRVPPRRPGSGSPPGRSGSPGGSMSPVSRRIMEGRQGGAGFLERLSRDIESRQAKAAAAARRAGRYVGGADEQQAERERELRDLRFVRCVCLGGRRTG